MFNFNSNRWFYFNEADHDAGSICLRMPVSELFGKKKAGKRFRIQGKKVKHRKDVVKDSFDMPMWKSCIVDWKNIWINGVEVKCTDTNKEELLSIPEFLILFLSFVTKYADDSADKLEKLT